MEHSIKILQYNWRKCLLSLATLKNNIQKETPMEAIFFEKWTKNAFYINKQFETFTKIFWNNAHGDEFRELRAQNFAFNSRFDGGKITIRRRDA